MNTTDTDINTDINTGNIHPLHPNTESLPAHSSIPKEQARDYICEILAELSQIAVRAQLDDLAAMIAVTKRVGRISD